MSRRRNLLLSAGLTATVATMVGVSFAAVPLYRLFCQATGYNGTPRTGPAAAPGRNEQSIRVRFDATTNSGLSWVFTPDVTEITVALGEERIATYSAQNNESRDVTGVATYNVVPDKAAQYFHKTECFCFNEQTLRSQQKVSLPLSFWVDPAISADPETQDIGTITLSYTFFRSSSDAYNNGNHTHATPITVDGRAGQRADLSQTSSMRR